VGPIFHRESFSICQFEYVAHFYGGLQLAQLSWANPGQIVRDVTFQSGHFQHLKWWPLRHLIPLSGRTISAILHFPKEAAKGRSGHKTCKRPLQFIAAAAAAATPKAQQQQHQRHSSNIGRNGSNIDGKRSETSSSLWPGGEPVRALGGTQGTKGTGQVGGLRVVKRQLSKIVSLAGSCVPNSSRHH